jgi:DNA-directed RNA polymerase subunit beta
VVFEEATHPNGQRLISARIIPFRGSWVEFTVDIHDVVYVHIDKKKKFPATALLRAFGYGSNSDILRLFFAVRDLDLTKKRESRVDVREVIGAIIAEDIALPAKPPPKTRPRRAPRRPRPSASGRRTCCSSRKATSSPRRSSIVSAGRTSTRSRSSRRT